MVYTEKKEVTQARGLCDFEEKRGKIFCRFFDLSIPPPEGRGHSARIFCSPCLSGLVCRY